MKKFSLLALAALLVVAMTIPAAAVEHEFGGYWRTRVYTQANFTGENETEAKDISRWDTRTRLCYTAKFSPNFKFVNKFELDAVWGDSSEYKTYGDVGADGVSVEVKNSYVDFTLGEQTFNIGVQDFKLAKGYLFDDDASGIKAIFKVSDFVYLPFVYIKANEGSIVVDRKTGKDAEDADVDAFVLYPHIYLNKDMTIKPHVAWLTSDNYGNYEYAGDVKDVAAELNIFTMGVEFDAKKDIYNFGATAVIQTGSIDLRAGGELDAKGYLFDIYGGMAMGQADVHAKLLYASGTDGTDLGFINPVGACHYWAEIMGGGIFDNQSAGTHGTTAITNLMAFNLGSSCKVLNNVTLSADLWYAKLVEEDSSGDDELGTELDLVASFPIVDNLKMDLVAAYLWAGDAFYSGKNQADPYEVGAQLSLAF
jgi:hypothetical protein